LDTGCGAVQRVNADNMDFFALFNLPASFALDEKALETAYKTLQKQLHPDKFAKASFEEKNISTETSALVNHAYATLKSSLHRAEYLLWLRFGQKAYESDTARFDPSLMAEMFEWREKVDESKDIPSRRQSVAKEIADEIELCEKELSIIFEQNHPTSTDSTQHALMATTRLKYFSKMMEELSESEDKQK
jgi:molecular chaperone HscB